MYIEELKSSVNQLMANLESMPVSKGGEFKLQKLKRGHNTSIIDMGQEDENTLSKSDVVLSFTLEVGGPRLINKRTDLLIQMHTFNGVRTEDMCKKKFRLTTIMWCFSLKEDTAELTFRLINKFWWVSQ